jgi:hypothetical protein
MSHAWGTVDDVTIYLRVFCDAVKVVVSWGPFGVEY